MSSTLVAYGFSLAVLLAVFRTVAAAVLRVVLVLFVLVLLASLLGSLDHTGPTTTSSTAGEVAVTSDVRADAIPIPWADAAPRWRETPRCPAAADPAGNLEALHSRVDELHALRDSYSQDHGTTAILRAENQLGECRDFVAVQMDRNVERPLRSALRVGEVPVWSETGLPPGWNVMHAEQKALAAAYLAGFRPIALAASRPFCDDGRAAGRVSCTTWLGASLAIPASGRTAWWAW